MLEKSNDDDGDGEKCLCLHCVVEIVFHVHVQCRYPQQRNDLRHLMRQLRITGKLESWLTVFGWWS